MISGSMNVRQTAGWTGMFVLSFLLSVVLLGGRANAMQLTPVQKQEMKQHYEKATRAYDVQKYSEAVEEYQRAYEIGGDPAMLYNVAQSYRLNDQLGDAQRFYRRYLQRSPNAANRDDVEKKIANLDKTIEERRRKAAAAPPPVAPAPVVISPPSRPEPPVRDVEGSPGMRIAGIVIASVGGAALVTAGVTGKLAHDKGVSLSNASNAPGTQFDPNLEKNGKTLNTVFIVSAIAGGAAVVTGAVLIWISRGASPGERQALVSPMVGGGGLVGATALVRF